MHLSLFLVLVSAVRSVASFGLVTRPKTKLSVSSPPAGHHVERRTESAVVFGQRSVVNLRKGQPLYMSNDEDSVIDDKADERRDELTHKYNVSFILFLAVSVILAIMPDRTNAVQLATKFGGAAGYGLAAGDCYVLSGATSHDRLSSDTYKRLNVGLLGFSLISLLAIPGEAAFHPSFGVAVLILTFMSFVRLLGASVAYKGWRRGVGPDSNDLAFGKMLGDFGKGVKSTLSGIYNTPRTGFVYLLYLLLGVAGGFSAFMQLLFDMQYKTSLFPISLQWSAFARLFLISTMVYSLKDAAERDRLTGTTFIQLNFLIGFWALAVGIGQGTSRLGFYFSRTHMLLCSVPFFYEGFRSQYKKSKKTKASE